MSVPNDQGHYDPCKAQSVQRCSDRQMLNP